MGARFPFASYPRGWFVVALSTDVAVSAVKTVHYFGQDIVLFRTVSGKLAALDRTCPHLGAHLGTGRVSGECLLCPFHAWAFDGTGRCVEVPYSSRIPAKASVSSWPVREAGGVVMVFYCPQGAAPTWEPPTLPEDGWTANRTIRWEIASHPQEVAESSVDGAHRRPMHRAISSEVLTVEQADHTMHVQSSDVASDIDLDVTLHGLGIIVETTHVKASDLRVRRRIYPTPIDDERIAIFGIFNIFNDSSAATTDPETRREVDEASYSAFIADFTRDFPIWETKAYLDNPMLVGDDGPIFRFRGWAGQFYDPTGAKPQTDTTARAIEQRGALVRLGAWLRRVAKPGEAELSGETDPPADEPPAPEPTLVEAAQTDHFASVDAYFNTLVDRFDPRAAGDLEAVIQWVLTGDPQRVHFAAIKAGRVALTAGVHEDPTLTIEMSADDYLSVINGELNEASVFTTGRGKLRGPVRLAMKMQRLFPLARVVH